MIRIIYNRLQIGERKCRFSSNMEGKNNLSIVSLGL